MPWRTLKVSVKSENFKLFVVKKNFKKWQIMIIQEFKTIKVQDWINILRFMLDFFCIFYEVLFHISLVSDLWSPRTYDSQHLLQYLSNRLHNLRAINDFELFFSSASILSFLVLWFIAAVSKSKSCYMFRASNGSFFHLFLWTDRGFEGKKRLEISFTRS